ncbi:MAG: hypothetical protein E6K72_03745 [Candidatus Eisenbacteria bacterium]|uniref:Uncharacterized protein n=1 Tax=Eiseniibacteriota bacterium TaxID=2212470 RepID=A0A538T191_UNCEI|nr:MAG: hypothetical protein E6K72_03745 [Candidatus Eisenbacteria bacterium]
MCCAPCATDAFLDDAPLEERRARAVMSRRVLEPAIADTLGALDPEAVARVRDEAWPAPESAEELHETLLWMGYATGGEVAASGWSEWLDELHAAGRVAREGNGGETRWFAAEASREPRAILRGRMEALGPVFVVEGAGPAAVPDGGARAGAVPAAHAGPRGGPEPPTVAPSDEPVLIALEAEGVVLRCRIAGRPAWCERRLLARIHRYTLSSPAGSMPTRHSSSRDRAASPRSCASLPASRSRRRSGRGACFPPASMITAPNGSIS